MAVLDPDLVRVLGRHLLRRGKRWKVGFGVPDVPLVDLRQRIVSSVLAQDMVQLDLLHAAVLLTEARLHSVVQSTVRVKISNCVLVELPQFAVPRGTSLLSRFAKVSPR